MLANAITNDNIKGIKIHDNEFELPQYDDDTTAFVSSDTKSATNVFKLLSNVQECSDLEYRGTSIKRPLSWTRQLSA